MGLHKRKRLVKFQAYVIKTRGKDERDETKRSGKNVEKQCERNE